MASLLISYWWILLLIIIIAAVITRSLIKLVLAVLGLLLILFVVLKVADIMVGPAIRNISDCYKETNQELAQMGIRIKQEQWDKQKICVEDKRSLENLALCYKKAVVGSPISSDTIEYLINLVPGQNFHLAALIQEHNTGCRLYPEAMVK